MLLLSPAEAGDTFLSASYSLQWSQKEASFTANPANSQSTAESFSMQPQPAGVVSKSGSQASRSGSQGGRCHSVSFSDQSTEPAATRSASGSVEKRTNSGSVEKRTALASALLSAVGSAASRMGDAAGRRMSSVLNEIAGDDASFRRDSFPLQRA